MLQNHQLIHQHSGKVSWFTPWLIIEAARTLMGSIDLDPASEPRANYRMSAIVADKIYTVADDGLTREWYGNVWLNPPFARGITGQWIDKAVEEWTANRAKQITIITFGATETKWFQRLAQFPQFFIAGRVNYLSSAGAPTNGVPKGSVITYLYPVEWTYYQANGYLAAVMRKHNIKGTPK